jgi:CRP-like cAMP-binding protein
MIIKDEYILSEAFIEYRSILHALKAHGKRTKEQKDVIWSAVVNKLSSSIPYADFNEAEKDKLCEEIEMVPQISHYSILFLQGDIGQCFFLIAYGNIGLYLELDKDKITDIARTFGAYRYREFPGDEDRFQQLGEKIATLPSGSGFGEGALLSRTNKTRMCAAVTTKRSSLVLVLQESTYNAIMAKHHFNKFQFSLATTLLRKLPQFNQYAYTQIALIAQTMKLIPFRLRRTIVKAGDVLNHVYIVHNGVVKAVSIPSKEDINNLPDICKRIPQLSVALLGYGQIIGEREMQLGLTHYQYTYISDSSDVELFEVPMNSFEQYVTGESLRQTTVYRQMKHVQEEKEQYRQALIRSWQDATHTMMAKKAIDVLLMEDFVAALPLIRVEGDNEALAEDDSNSKKRQSMISMQSHSLKIAAVINSPKSPPTPPPSRIKAPNLRSHYKPVAFKTPKEKAMALYNQMLKTT